MKHRIEPIEGFTPSIGRLVGMLTYSRDMLLQVVEGLSGAQLDALHDTKSNSIGALLAHIAAVERWYQIFTFEGRDPSGTEEDAWLAALDLGDKGREQIRGNDLSFYQHELSRTRALTLSRLAERDDSWLEAPLAADAGMNAHWAWFHVAEDEISHRGQIRWLRARLGV